MRSIAVGHPPNSESLNARALPSVLRTATSSMWGGFGEEKWA
jgi:hypothetical protein